MIPMRGRTDSVINMTSRPNMNALCRQKDNELLEAARHNNVKAIERLLISEKVNPLARGELGETALHMALLCNSQDAAMMLIHRIPPLLNQPITSDMYQGQTALHIAVMNQDVQMVRELLSCGADLHSPRATGSCFTSADGSSCYYGEFVLSFAVCTGNGEIVRLLVKNGATLKAQDSLGNSVLHVLVQHPNGEMVRSMYDLLSELVQPDEWCQIESLANSEGYTPLKLAVALGDDAMFSYLVERRKKVYWTMGTISYTVYDLREIDTWGDQRSVLDIITSSSKKKVQSMIDLRPVKDLLNHKWNSFGFNYFLVWMFSYVFYVMVFTICCLYRPLKLIPPELSDNITIMVLKEIHEAYSTKEDFVRLLGEIITVMGAAVILYLEVPYIIKIGPKNYCKNTVIGGPFPVLMVCYSCLIAIIMVLRVMSHEGESIAMSLALVLGWCNTLYFARGFELLGPFSIMIQKIIFGDLMRWCCLLVICVFGFTAGFYVVFQTLDSRVYPNFQNFAVTFFTAIELMMGLIELPVPYDRHTPYVIYLIFIVYMIFAYLLMLNLLIATMDDTFWRVAHERMETWKIQIAASTLLLERRIPKSLRHRSGVPGNLLGYNKNIWYLGVEEIKEANWRRKNNGGGMDNKDGPSHWGEDAFKEMDSDLKMVVCRWDTVRQNLAKIIVMSRQDETVF
ncbi:transient receptor potential cation channel subfamily V member 6-like [Lampetra fluviatilis]